MILIVITQITILCYLYIHLYSYLRSKKKLIQIDDSDLSYKYSLVMVVSNEQDLLQESLEGILSQKNIKLREIIIVVNNSNDDTLKIANLYKNNLKIINIDNFIGKSSALIEGINNATSDRIFLLDVDTRLQPDALFKLASYSEKTNSQFCIGIINYKKFSTWQSKIIEYERYFINSFLQVARGFENLATLHGSFCLVDKQKYLSFQKDKVLQEDLLVTYKLIGSNIPIKTFNEIVAEEQDRTKLSLFILQRSRWVTGNIKVFPIFFKNLIRTNSFRKFVYFSSYPFLWYFMYYILVLGYLLSLKDISLLLPTILLHINYTVIVYYSASQNHKINLLNIYWSLLHSLIFPVLISVASIIGIVTLMLNINSFNNLFFRRN